MSKFYGVKNGRKIGIFTNIDDYYASMSGFSGSNGKVCDTEEEAVLFVYGIEAFIEKYKSKVKPKEVITPKEEIKKQSLLYLIKDAPIEIIDAFDCTKVLKEYFDLIEKKYSQLYNKIHSVDLELSNLIHKLEFGNLQDEEKLSLANEIEAKRIERRKYKDSKYKFDVLYKLLVKHNQIKFDLQCALENIYSKNEAMKNRSFDERIIFED